VTSDILLSFPAALYHFSSDSSARRKSAVAH
jgi:hypothetical protein